MTTWSDARQTIDQAGTSRLRTGSVQAAFVKKMRTNPTAAEAALWVRLDGKQMGTRFRRQRTILQYVVDFYCPGTGLVVEVDGGYHGSSPEQISYEQRRDAELGELGLTVLRFTNERVLGELDQVVNEIAACNAHLGVHRPLLRRLLIVNGTKNQGGKRTESL